MMEKARLDDFPGGWVVGHFLPSVLHSHEVEVAIKSYKASESEPEHFQQTATEITIVVKGSCMLNGELLTEGDLLSVPPGISGSFEALTDVQIVAIKSPSLAGDKVLGTAPSVG